MTDPALSERGLTTSAPPSWSGLEPVRELLERAAGQYPKHPALRFCGRLTTYSEWNAKVEEAAGVLRRMGAGPGVQLALLLPTCPAIPTYIFAAFSVGASVVALDPEAPEGELDACVRAAGVTILISCDVAAFQTKALNLTQRTGIPTLMLVAYAAMLPAASAARLLSLGRTLARPTPAAGPRVLFERTLLRDKATEAVVQSGPTPRAALPSDTAFIVWVNERGVGRPIELSHASLARNLAQLCAALPKFRQGGERVLAALPWWHPLAFMLVGVAMIDGAGIAMLPELSVGALSAALKRTTPTVIMVSPPFLAGLLEQPDLDPSALTALTLTITLGGPISAPLQEAFAARARGALIESYALAIAPHVVALTQPGDANPSAALQPLAGTRFSVRDFADPTRDVPAGERGELFVAGPQMGAPGRGAEFQRTGDLALMDALGRVILIDRIEDLIVAAGYLIYPRRIEAALAGHPGVAEAAVIGIPDARRGNAPKAFIVLKRGMAITERDLRLHLASRISKIEMPADIDFCTSLPRDPFGFVCKAALRSQEAARAASGPV